jgi:hypothetical protein
VRDFLRGCARRTLAASAALAVIALLPPAMAQTRLPHPFGLSTLNGVNGVRFDGAEMDDGAGGKVSGAGDVNGDGCADLLIGAGGAGPAGASYVVLGSSSGIPHSFGALNLSALNGRNGVRLDGIDAMDGAAYAAGSGDINGDGVADVLIGAFGADPGGDSSAGESYLVFGSSSGLPHISGALALSTLNGANGVRIDGIDADDRAGRVSGAGDVNGDGFADLLIGATGADPDGRSSAGETYLVYGSSSGVSHTSGVLDLSTLNGINGVRLDGIDPSDRFGCSVSGAGDINGDGYCQSPQ